MGLFSDPLYLYLGLTIVSFFLLGWSAVDRNHRILSYGMMTVGILLGIIHATFWMVLGVR